MSCYATRDDVLAYDLNPRVPFKGTAAVAKDWSDFFASAGAIRLESGEIEVTAPGDTAYAHFVERGMITTKAGKELGVDLRTTHVYTKIGGHWSIVYVHKSKAARP